jgi:lysophospholipase L1-like esterase
MGVMRGLRFIALAAGTLGGVYGAAYGLLTGQARRAERIIGPPVAPPHLADGVYLPDGSGPVPPAEEDGALRFAMFGDSMAAGLGVDGPDQLPAVVLARGLAEEAGRPVRLDTYAVVGAATRDLPAQVEQALLNPPEVAVIIVGANDVTTLTTVPDAVAGLERVILTLMDTGCGVVIGTCPDLGVIRPIAQPLKSIARTWSLLLARAQRKMAVRIGAIPVPLADLLAPEFLARPREFFSPDQFHPSSIGYEAAASVLLPALCTVAGVWTGGPLPRLPVRSAVAESRRPTARFIARLNLRLGRPVRELGPVSPTP